MVHYLLITLLSLPLMLAAAQTNPASKDSPETLSEFGPDLYVTDVLKSGATLRLSDGTLFDIAPDDQPTAHGWLGGPEVKVSHFPEQEYPYHIVNTISGSFVKAKKAKAPTSPPLAP